MFKDWRGAPLGIHNTGDKPVVCDVATKADSNTTAPSSTYTDIVPYVKGLETPRRPRHIITYQLAGHIIAMLPLIIANDGRGLWIYVPSCPLGATIRNAWRRTGATAHRGTAQCNVQGPEFTAHVHRPRDAPAAWLSKRQQAQRSHVS